MKIKYVLGDLFSHPGRHILHGCNAQGVMGSGVAKVVRERYPQAYTKYLIHHSVKGLSLGEVIAVDCGRHIILNGVTQQFFGSDGGLYLNYDAISTVIRRSCEIIVTNHGNSHLPLDTLAMPLIGAGLAGGDWTEISRRIEAETTNVEPIVYIHEKATFDKIVASTS